MVLYDTHSSYSAAIGLAFAAMRWSLKVFSNLILADGPLSLRHTSSNEHSLPSYPTFKSLVKYFALLLYLNIRFISFI